jgi:hypothetical protein
MSAFIFKKLDTSLGTLWWVRENVWKDEIPFYYFTNRNSHPGLSISEAKALESRAYVPMLHGTSKRKGNCVAVWGLTRVEREHFTYFGQIKPAKIDACLFTSWTTALGPDDPDWTRHAAIVLNRDKPWISSKEEKE